MKGRGFFAAGAAAVAIALFPATAPAAVVVPTDADADPSLLLPAMPHGHAGALDVDLLHDAFLRFQLPPVSTRVLKAQLRVYADNGTVGGLAATEVSAGWSEDSLTWLSGQHPRGLPVDFVPVVPTHGDATFDVTDGVQGGGLHAFAISGGALDPAVLASRERGAMAPQISLVAATPAQDALARIVAAPQAADAVSYGTKDDQGASLDTLKIVAAPPSDSAPYYLGVYHHEEQGVFITSLATSTDLLHWHRVRDVDQHASQPTIALIPGGGVLIAEEVDAVESDGISRGHVRFLRWDSVGELLGGRPPARVFDAPRVLSPGFEGTPEIDSVDVAADRIRVRLHYLSSAPVDRVASGTLTGFLAAGGRPGWSEARDDGINDPVMAAGATQNIGDLDDLTFDGAPLSLVEGQTSHGDFGAFAPYVVDPGTEVAERVAVRTAGHSRSFGNPTATLLRLPDGKPGIVVTLFVFGPGSGPGEGGELVFFRHI